MDNRGRSDRDRRYGSQPPPNVEVRSALIMFDVTPWVRFGVGMTLVSGLLLILVDIRVGLIIALAAVLGYAVHPWWNER
jgi:hypothetical protein